MSRKLLSILMILCLLIPGAALATSASPEVVRVALGTGQYNMWYRALEAEAEAATGLDIQFVEMAGGLEAMMMEVISGGASDIDVWDIDGPNIPQFAANGYIIPLDSYISAEDKADFFPVALDAVSYDGAVYALPYVVHGLSLFYNTAMFEAAGITQAPQTIEEVVADARILTDAANGVYGLAVEGKQHEEPVGHLIDWIVRFGGAGLLDKEGNLVFGDQATVDTFQWLHDLVFVEKVVPPECVSWICSETGVALQQGTIAMCLNWPYLYAESKKPEATAPEVVGNISMVALPSTNCVWAWCYGIMSTSKRQDAAFKFLEWAASADTITKFGTELLVPVCRASAKANIQANTAISEEDRVALINLTATLEQGYAPGLSANYSALRNRIGETLSKIMINETIDIAAEVAACKADLEQMLAELD